MSEIYTDKRFDIIASAKQKIIEETNITTSPDEMAVLDSLLFRMWQMGWLPGCKGDAELEIAHWISVDKEDNVWKCSNCGGQISTWLRTPLQDEYYYCQYCGKKMKKG